MPKLRIAVLTTDTLHHRYFVKRLFRETANHTLIVLNLFETKPYPWKTKAWRHFYSQFPNLWQGMALNPYLQVNMGSRTDAYERPRFFPDGDTALSPEIPSRYVHSVNGAEAQAALEEARADLILIYGTGLVKSEIYRLAGLGAINAHGGKIPGYRGIDTNLWAAYENHPEDMTVTLHQVDEGLDTGPVYLSRAIGRPADLSLVSLSYHTAVLCTDMFVELTASFADGRPQPTPQDSNGSSYYAPMPWLLKRRTDRILAAWASGGEVEAFSTEENAA